MNKLQKTIFKSWIKDNLFLIDGLLIHRHTARSIACHFRDTETGRNMRHLYTDKDVRDMMIELGYVPTSEKENCSFVPSIESNFALIE